MENLSEITKIIGGILAVLIGVFKLVAFFTPENRKNLRSNVSEFKSVAAAKKKHLVVAIISFAAAIVLLVFFFWDKLNFGTVNNPEMNAVNAGDIFEFGGSDGNKMEWIVIEKNRHDLTLLSRNCLEAKPYQENFNKEKKLKWKNSTLKSWLNGEFIKNFSESDQSAMLEFRDGGFISLLDKNQVKKIEKEHKEWLVCTSASKEQAKGWWLQTPKGDCVMFVNSSGKVESSCTKYFDNRADKSLFVRPVIRKKM